MSSFNQSKTPKFVILFFVLLLNFLTFFQSKKILLWEEKTENVGSNVFEGIVLTSASFYETLKEKIELKDFFDREHLFWLKLKTSPIFFATFNFNQLEKKEIISEQNSQQDTTESIQQKIKTITPKEIEEKELSTTILDLYQTPLEKNQVFSEEVSRISPIILQERKEQKTQEGESKIFTEKETRILVIGDSMVAVGGGLGEMLEKELKKEFPNAKILREGKVSSGLSRPDYFDWEARLKQLISQFQPNITILVFGLNDCQALTDTMGKVVVSYGKFGQKEWAEEYGKRVRRMIEILNENRIFVFWVGLPIVKDTSFANRLKFLNQIYESEVRKFENAIFISTWCILCENEQYTDYLYDENGVRKLVRTSDGIHFQYFGGRIVSQFIVKEIKNNLNL